MFARTHTQRLTLSRNLKEVSIPGTHSSVEIDIRLLTNQETEDQEKECVGRTTYATELVLYAARIMSSRPHHIFNTIHGASKNSV